MIQAERHLGHKTQDDSEPDFTQASKESDRFDFALMICSSLGYTMGLISY